MPVFYDVDPSDVRKQKRKFGEAFAKHESEKNFKVESWRKALVDASNISGWEPKHIANGHESKGIKEIVDTISNKLLAFISIVDEDLVGMRTRVQDLKSRLEIGLGGVFMVGIWGVGGGGKTTLASTVYDEISRKFECCCFLENIREKSQRDDGLEKLQEKVLCDVLKQSQVKVGRVNEGKTMIRSRLCHKNVLIVLDDIDHLDQLKALAGSPDWFGEGSRIIITTRDEHVLKAHNTKVIHNISLLHDFEAIQLFCKHAFLDYRPTEDYETLSKEVISYAGGLPLALKVIGRFLCDKDTNEWSSALARLKDIPETDIVEKLKISFDGLKPIEKELFLDIACFFRGECGPDAMTILNACGFHPVIGLKVLVQKALIIVHDDGSFDMHDLIQEMGHFIVRGEHPNNPEKHSRVWKYEDIQKICYMHATMENDKIEAINFEFYDDYDPNLPKVLANMKKLRWISAFDHPAIPLPQKFSPTELCYLSVEGGLMKQLWVDYKHLPCLKVLELPCSENLVKTPDFSGLPYLERLFLCGCSNLKEIHPSIGYHERLKYVDVSSCKSLEMFPPIIHMRKLETLKISECSSLRRFPEIQMNMDCLVELEMAGSGIEVVPSSVGEYCTNLALLDLSYSFCLKRIEANFHLLKQLKRLRLSGFYQISLQAKSPLFFPLQLPYIPHSLTSLDLSNSKLVDGDIPSNISYLSNLEQLNLSGNMFSDLSPLILSQLPVLKFLNLSRCRDLLALPDLPSTLAILCVDECESLEIVGDFPTNCKWLWKVSFRRIKKLDWIEVERVAQSMLEGNAVEDYFMRLHFGPVDIPALSFQYNIFRLKLPCNWENDFTGFFIYLAGGENRRCTIVIKQEKHMDHQPDLLQGFHETDGMDKTICMCYISFGVLRRTSWWESTYTHLSFRTHRFNHHSRLHVELVPRKKSKAGDLFETSTNFSEFWDVEDEIRKSFKIRHDSKSSLQIEWSDYIY